MKHTAPATIPMITAGVGPTKPDAGVMATNPATAPDAMPNTLGLPRLIHSAEAQALAEHQAAGEAGDACIDVHHRAARIVEHARLVEPAGRLPHHVGDR